MDREMRPVISDKNHPKVQRLECKIGSGDNNHTITLDMGVNVKHGLWQELELALL